MKFCEDLDGEDGKGNVFELMTKRLVSGGRDFVGAGCVRDDGEKIVVGGWAYGGLESTI